MSNGSARPRFGFSQMKLTFFLVFARNVLLKLKDNLNFPTVQALLANLEELVEEYANAIDAAFNRDKVKVAERNAKREELENYLKMLAASIMAITSNREILLTSGFEITTGKGPVEPVGKVSGMKYSFIPGVQGTVKLRWSRASVREAASFVVEQATGNPDNPDTVWSIVSVPSKCSCTISGLTPGATYWWRVYGIGALGAGGKSDPVSTIVL